MTDLKHDSRPILHFDIVLSGSSRRLGSGFIIGESRLLVLVRLQLANAFESVATAL